METEGGGEGGARRGPHTVENSWKNVAIKQLFKTCPLLTSLKVFRRLCIANAQSKYSLCRRYGNFTPRTHSHPSVSCFCMQKKRRRERESESALNSEDSKWQQRSVDFCLCSFWTAEATNAVNRLWTGCRLWDYFFVTGGATSVAEHCCGANPPREDWLDFCSREPFVFAASGRDNRGRCHSVSVLWLLDWLLVCVCVCVSVCGQAFVSLNTHCILVALKAIIWH